MKKGQVEYLKFCAFAFMVCDHVGAYLFPEIQVLRVLGRLAFPLFAFALVQGFRNTSDFKRYSTRILSLALIWQVFYTGIYISGYVPASEPFNFVFILFLGLHLLNAIKEKLWSHGALIFLFAVMLDALKFTIPYGSYGLAFISLIYLFDQKVTVLTFCLFVLSSVPILMGIYPVQQLFACLFVVLLVHPLSMRNIPRQFYYFAYPIHLLIIFGFKYVQEF